MGNNLTEVYMNDNSTEVYMSDTTTEVYMSDTSTKVYMSDTSTKVYMSDTSTKINIYTSTHTSIKNANHSDTTGVYFKGVTGHILQNLLWNFGAWLTLMVFFRIFQKKLWTFQKGTFGLKTGVFLNCDACTRTYLLFQHYIKNFMTAVLVMHLIVFWLTDYSALIDHKHMIWGLTISKTPAPDSSFLWAEATMAFLYFPLAIFTMRKFVIKLGIKHCLPGTHRTLMISHIPDPYSTESALTHYFQENYPDTWVQKIYVAQDLTKLNELVHERRRIYKVLTSCVDKITEDDESFKGLNFYCGLSIPCIRSDPMDAVDVYVYKYHRLGMAIVKERNKIPLKPSLGIAFVTFTTLGDAHYVCESLADDFAQRASDNVPFVEWKAQYAPPAKDILWDNLKYPPHGTEHMRVRYFPFLCSTYFLVLSIILIPETLPFGKAVNPICFSFSGSATEFFLNMLLWLDFSILLLEAVSLKDWRRDWLKSTACYKTMRISYIYVVLMLLIFPSILYESTKAYIHWFIGHHDYRSYQVVQYPGYFIFNFILTSALLGSALEYFGIPDLSGIFSTLLISRTKVEHSIRKEEATDDFPCDMNLVWMLGVLTMILGFGPSSFAAIVLGWIYINMKHFVDKYKIAYTYFRVDMSTQLYAIAIKLFIITAIIPQFRFLFILCLYYGFSNVTFYSATGVILTMLFLQAHKYMKWWEDIIPFPYQECMQSPDYTEDSYNPRKYSQST